MYNSIQFLHFSLILAFLDIYSPLQYFIFLILGLWLFFFCHKPAVFKVTRSLCRLVGGGGVLQTVQNMITKYFRIHSHNVEVGLSYILNSLQDTGNSADSGKTSWTLIRLDQAKLLCTHSYEVLRIVSLPSP